MFPARAITLLALGTMENTNLDHPTRAAIKRACHYENAVKRFSSECQNGNPILALVLEAEALAMARRETHPDAKPEADELVRTCDAGANLIREECHRLGGGTTNTGAFMEK
jgi:hypothetical protein